MSLLTTFVVPQGPPTARLWGLGEAPGEEEDKIGIPFIGPAGRRLDAGLKDSGILRPEIFLWNIFHRRPPKNDVGYFFTDHKHYIPTEEGAAMIVIVKEFLEKFRPNCVLAFGNTAMAILTGKTQITKWRGSVLPCTLVEGIKVYPTYHPSYVSRLMQERGSYQGEDKEELALNVYPTFVKDLRRALYQAGFPEIRRPPRNLHVVRHLEEARALLRFESGSKVAVDIETLYKDDAAVRPVVTRIGFASSSSHAFSIPFTRGGHLCWTLNEWADLLVMISEALLREDVVFILQNGFYDLTILGVNFSLRLGVIPDDTMVQMHCAYPHLPKGLAYQTSVFTWEPYYKDDHKSHGLGQMDEALSIYNARDCAVTKELQPITERDIISGGFVAGYRRTRSLFPALIFMMTRGVKFDRDRREKMSVKFKEHIEECWLRILERTGDPSFNPNSNIQLQHLFYEKLHLPEQYNKEGSLTADKSAIFKLKHISGGDPIFDAITDYKKYSKLLSTYIQMEVSEDGRIYTTYDPTGTTTWRISSYASPLGLGGNLTNIPKRDEEGREIRELFCADDGYKLGAADYSQAEDRYVVWKAGDLKAIERYNRGVDSHWENAKDIFGLDPQLVYNKADREHYRLRNKIAKHAKHAGNYGMGPRQFQRMLGTMADMDMPYSECVEILERQWQATPMIQAWKQWVRQKISTDRTLITALKRKRIFYGRVSDDLFRKAYAFEPQSTVGELALLALREVFSFFDPELCHPLMDVHDEVIFQYRPSDEHYVLSTIKELMSIPLSVQDIYGTTRELIIPVEFKVGPNWGALEEVKV